MDTFIVFITVLCSCLRGTVGLCSHSRTVERKGFASDDVNSTYDQLVIRRLNVSKYDCIEPRVKDVTARFFLYNEVLGSCTISNCFIPVTLITGPSDFVLYGAKEAPPASCADVRSREPASGDGEYWLYPPVDKFLGCPVRIYCYAMNLATPSEYITLPAGNTGNYPDAQNENCDGESIAIMDLESGFNVFEKVRVDIKNMAIYRNYYTFVWSNGTNYPYGEARSCYTQLQDVCGGKGTFDIDTRGTGVIVDPEIEWITVGYKSKVHSVVRSEGGSVINIVCGGYCGGCYPHGLFTLIPKWGDEPDENEAQFVLY